VVADKADFQEMCRGVFNHLGVGAGDKVQATFQNLIKAVDRRTKVLSDYNPAFARIAEQQLTILGMEKTLREEPSVDLSNDEVQVLDQFSSRIFMTCLDLLSGPSIVMREPITASPSGRNLR